MALKLKGREAWSVPIFLGIFSIGGFTMGMSSEVLVFVPIGIAMARSLGFDVLTGTAMVTLGANVGYTAGLMNPFGVGLAQMIAGVPLFSGMWLRAIFLVLIIAVTSVYILRYAYRVRSDPSRDLLAGVEDIRDDFHTEGADLPPIERYHWFVLLVLAAGFGTLIWGVSAKKWWIPEMGGIFMMMGILSGFVAGYGPSKIAKCFGEGAKELVGGAITVGLARGIMVVMNDAHIVDTIVYGLSNLVGALPMALQLMGLYAAQILISLLVVSSTGQAAITMPILTPLADLLGVTRQTAVLIFQFSDGFTNNILPTSSATMGALSVARIPYAKWLRFMMPLLGIWLLIGGAFILAAQMIGYR
jgi:uncharacterized ion transporter superfamily protein YfcC